MTSTPGTDVTRAGDALLALAEKTTPELAAALARLVAVVADEAARTPRFANALGRALAGGEEPGSAPRKGGRRASGPIDPYEVYATDGEAGLRSALGRLDLEQLRDIVAEHGMDNDRLAMKWKDANRVIDRIVDRVKARAAKGSAFRSPADGVAN